MATAERHDVTPPAVPVFAVTLTVTEQEAKDLVVVLGLLPAWGDTGKTIASAFSALEFAGYRYVDARNEFRDSDKDRYKEFHDWVTTRG